MLYKNNVFALQLINTRVVAELTKKHGFKIRVIGLADSAMGSVENNETVALNCAKYISYVLAKIGLSEESIMMQSVGGDITVKLKSYFNITTGLDVFTLRLF